MTDASLAVERRGRHWLADAATGGGLALCIITAANAALPKAAEPKPTPAADPPVASRSRPAPAGPTTLIAFQRPLPGYQVGSPFGLRRLPWEVRPRLHAGVDIEAPAGTPILAAADGVVTRVGQDGGLGRFVELEHAAGLSSVYGHLGAFVPGVVAGAVVKAGAPIGRIGDSGSSSGAHLHFEIRDHKRRPLDPQRFLGRRFADAGELPLSAALRVPRAVRVAYVSSIPRAKRAEMQARQEQKLAAAAADTASDVGEISSAIESATPAARPADQRPRARFAIAG